MFNKSDANMVRTAWELSAGLLSFVVAIGIGWWFGTVLDQNLQAAGMFDAEAAPRDQTDDRPREHDEHRHHEVIGDDVGAGWEREPQRPQRGRDDRAEQSVHRLDDPEFVFELFHWSASTVTATTSEEAPATTATGGRPKRASIT